MNHTLRKNANQIIEEAIASVAPEEAVKKALQNQHFQGRVYMVAVGKAGYSMAKAASSMLDFEKGIVITKYNHVKEKLEDIDCYEAGHPTPDENGVEGTKKVLEMVSDLKEEDTVLFLLSGGGSALFESPVIPLEELQDITNQLLRSGADIKEINSIRKRLSMVKGGKFAKLISPAKVYAVILSDILGDPVDMIASGPTVSDTATTKDVAAIVDKYHLSLSESAKQALESETPKDVDNANNIVIGSVKQLCLEAKKSCEKLGYKTSILMDDYDGEAHSLGEYLGNLAVENKDKGKLALIAGGESVVHLKGKGLGGRNQEIAVAAMEKISGISNVAVFSVGSDGTDGPTDAAGGYVDGESMDSLEEKDIPWKSMQADNDCYHILKKIDGLVITGPTGTNVNDVSVVLIDEN